MAHFSVILIFTAVEMVLWEYRFREVGGGTNGSVLSGGTGGRRDYLTREGERGVYIRELFRRLDYRGRSKFPSTTPGGMGWRLVLPEHVVGISGCLKCRSWF